MSEERIWSHSSLNTIMNNPAEFYLVYKCGIKPKQEKTALSLGSAVHWGLENNTDDLTEFYNEKGSFKQWNSYTEEQLLAECIVGAYLRKKDDIYKEILKDDETGKVLDILDEIHELKLNLKLPSTSFETDNQFLGIIDLLLLTDKGWILIDYKTSSQKVDYDEYKSQLYKYIQLLQFNFPDVPIYKIGIINLRKTQIRRKKGENDESFKRRIKLEYDLEENDLIEFHTYKRNEFDENQLKDFSETLSKEIDAARLIESNNLFFVNYSNIKGMYGPSQYYDIFYKTKDNYMLYLIKDTIYDKDFEEMKEYRDCEPLDMMCLDTNIRILNKYDLFVEELEHMPVPTTAKDSIFTNLKKKYMCSDKLLNIYYDTYTLKSNN